MPATPSSVIYPADACYWQQVLDQQPSQANPISSARTYDVAIIGGGFSGLWTAYYLKKRAADLSVAVFEAYHCGFGASGRNGGWLMGNLAGEHHWMPSLALPEQDSARRLITGIVDEIKNVCATEDINCDLAHGGTLYIAARYPEQEVTQRSMLQELHDCGYREDDYRWLSPSEMQQQVHVAPCYGGVFTPHTAAIHPGKLVQGLLDTVKNLGVDIHDFSPVERVSDRSIVVRGQPIAADIIVNATEAYDPFQPNHRPYNLPLQSQIASTVPLSESQWQQIGIAKRQTFAEASKLVTYAQRTADNRLVFGTRGNYRFGGHPSPQFQLAPQGQHDIRSLIGSLFPSLRDVEFSHTWTGSLGLAKSDTPYSIFDPHSGQGWLGGYGGEGVGATNLMARTLVDQIFHESTERTQAPWAKQGTPRQILRRWEPEPLRWIGYKSIRWLLQHEEQACENRNTSEWYRRLISRIAEFINKTFL